MEPIRKDMELLSNSMATFAHVKANPESFALFFMMGVCFGLLLALCLLVAGIACKTRRRVRPPVSPERTQLKESSEEEEGEDESLQEEEARSSEVPKVTVAAAGERGGRGGSLRGGTLRDGTLRSGTLRDGTLRGGTLQSVDVFASAEELERARRLEERERIVREIWRNGQPDILATGTGTIGRVHYH